ncbi:hypothetical protein CLV59_109165 [Chitinophaga dinghuensis]|uniref:Uncharacterized protein n=1 Tax=Chitinophaga dinghuensis TaxID=1539050 RepID=A0A327VWJ5_9BACT|nr:hypothetical protein [Chitinophaga dinghuensis]RAJ75551.1 hypothetical protein CLV59_109165 [Chitinophaga dinghuensis]
MMKIIFIFSLFLLKLFITPIYCQNITVVNRLLVKDSLALGSSWIHCISDDSDMLHAGSNALANDAALKNYMSAALKAPVLTSSSRSDSLLSIDPLTRKYCMVPNPMEHNPSPNEVIEMMHIHPHILRFKYFRDMDWGPVAMEVVSSDGTINSMALTGESGMLFAFGRPPFTLKIDNINSFPDKAIGISLYKPRTEISPYVELSRTVLPGDTQTIVVDELTGGYDLYLGLIQASSSSMKKLIMRSETNNFMLGLLREYVWPGKTKDISVTTFGYGNSIEFWTIPFVKTQTGEYAMIWNNPSKYSTRTLTADIYINNVFYQTKTFTGKFSLPNDSTWNTIEVILKDPSEPMP